MDIPYKILRSRRRTIAVHITRNGEVELRCPLGFPTREAEEILRSKRGWIEKQLSRHMEVQMRPPFTQAEVEEMKKALRPKLEERVRYYADAAGVTYGKITVRSQKSIWGSCSRTGNLSFNCLLSQVPEEVLDYVVVHELCHRKQMNHSSAFWQEVEALLPNYWEPRKWLKDQGGQLIARYEK